MEPNVVDELLAYELANAVTMYPETRQSIAEYEDDPAAPDTILQDCREWYAWIVEACCDLMRPCVNSADIVDAVIEMSNQDDADWGLSCGDVTINWERTKETLQANYYRLESGGRPAEPVTAYDILVALSMDASHTDDRNVLVELCPDLTERYVKGRRDWHVHELCRVFGDIEDTRLPAGLSLAEFADDVFEEAARKFADIRFGWRKR